MMKSIISKIFIGWKLINISKNDNNQSIYQYKKEIKNG
jgi:hypothetical protein